MTRAEMITRLENAGGLPAGRTTAVQLDVMRRWATATNEELEARMLEQEAEARRQEQTELESRGGDTACCERDHNRDGNCDRHKR